MHSGLVVILGADCFNDSARARYGCDTGNVVLERGLTNLLFVTMRNATQRSVYDQRDFTLLDVVHDIGTTLINLEYFFDFESDLAQPRGRAHSRPQLESQSNETASEQHCLTFVGVIHTDESSAARWKRQTRGSHRFAVGFAERIADSHHFSGRVHLRSENGIDFRKLSERKHR